MQVKHVVSVYSDEFEQKINAALEGIEKRGKVIKEIKYLFTDRYFTALILFN